MVEFKGGSLHDGFGGFDGLVVLESTLPSVLLVQQNNEQRGNHDGFGGFGGGYIGFGRDGYPPLVKNFHSNLVADRSWSAANGGLRDGGLSKSLDI